MTLRMNARSRTATAATGDSGWGGTRGAAGTRAPSARVALLAPPAPAPLVPDQRESLGLCYLGEALRQAGCGVTFYNTYRAHTGAVREAAAREIAAGRPTLVGSTLFALGQAEGLDLLARLRPLLPGALLVVGGQQATFTAREALERYLFLDVVVRGEGERAVVELAEAVGGRRRLADIQGITWRQHREIRENPARPLLTAGELDRLPFPARDMLYQRGACLPVASVAAGRGCPGACTFCSIQRFYGMSDGAAYRLRSVRGVVRELGELHQRHGVRRFSFVDDSFLCSSRWLRAFTAAYLEAGLAGRADFVCSARSEDVLRAANLLPALAAAGCRRVALGLESGA